jgi:hypothetical protein
MSRARIYLGLGLSIVAVLAGLGIWWFSMRRDRRLAPRANAIHVIAPYWSNGTWVFDDPRVGLEREPFVAGVPEMIDVLVEDIPSARSGFRLLFSARSFPGAQKMLTWTRGEPEGGGNYYRLDDPPMEGWLCPALFHYYQTPPAQIFVRAEPLDRSS